MSLDTAFRVSTRAPIHRDRWGRPIILTGELRADGSPRMTTCQKHNDDEPGCQKPIPGIPYRRVTTFIDVIGDRTQLEKWKMRSVALGLLNQPVLMSEVSASADDKRALDKICDRALTAGGATEKRDHGKALHKLTELVDMGATRPMTVADQADVNAYVTACVNAGIRHLELETTTVHDAWCVAGTFDRLIEIDGVRYIADIKTGDIDFDTRKVAMQMAMYADGKRYDLATGDRSELQADTEHGLIIHLPAGEARCDLVWVDLNIGRQYNELARQVWHARDRGNDEVRVGQPPALGTLLRMSGDVDSLNGLYYANATTRWNDTLTEIARQRRAELEAS
jgi:hypothetical protein